MANFCCCFPFVVIAFVACPDFLVSAVRSTCVLYTFGPSFVWRRSNRFYNHLIPSFQGHHCDPAAGCDSSPIDHEGPDFDLEEIEWPGNRPVLWRPSTHSSAWRSSIAPAPLSSSPSCSSACGIFPGAGCIRFGTLSIPFSPSLS